MGVMIGRAAAALAEQKDNLRITSANKRSCETTKERWMQIRSEKARENEYFEETEGILYQDQASPIEYAQTREIVVARKKRDSLQVAGSPTDVI
ncbi:hypothetical protein EAG_16022 [Camponotus floridanus]|uniref:Uncharacterized protein n=1 Tax=Camponotus floridanus TaxID=104421 RepID=E2B0C1_CAMFO|nr:hypothetical protein EAG_16022 [Camponotus floridanus]